MPVPSNWHSRLLADQKKYKFSVRDLAKGVGFHQRTAIRWLAGDGVPYENNWMAYEQWLDRWKEGVRSTDETLLREVATLKARLDGLERMIAMSLKLGPPPDSQQPPAAKKKRAK